MKIDEEFDLIVIGSGPGGQKAVIQGADGGLKVALFERERQLVGTCIHEPSQVRPRAKRLSTSPPLDGTPMYSISK